MKTIADFSIAYYQSLPDDKDNTDNININKFDAIKINILLLKKFYQTMLLTRLFDARAISLQRTGKLGTYPSSLGQEAIGTAIGYALQPEDVFVTYYRDYAAQLLRGVSMTEILLYWGGSERGNNYQSPLSQQDPPVCVPIASQCLHAAGIASAMNIRREKRAVVVTCGDGGTSEGDFYETLNIAGVWNLPLVIVIINNQWAISVPREKQSAAQTLAQKAIAAGINGEQADGNDVIALYDRLTVALDKARSGQGPTVIEALTYRMSDHTTADDASRYRNKIIPENIRQSDPLIRLKNYLLINNAWSENEEQNYTELVNQQIYQAVQDYFKMPSEDNSHIFNYHFAAGNPHECT